MHCAVANDPSRKIRHDATTAVVMALCHQYIVNTSASVTRLDDVIRRFVVS